MHESCSPVMTLIHMLMTAGRVASNGLLRCASDPLVSEPQADHLLVAAG